MSSSRFSKDRRKSAAARTASDAPSHVQRDEESLLLGLSHQLGGSSSLAIRARRRSRAFSTTSGLSGSYTLPSRSYLHNTVPGGQEAQYSSVGVRDQTAELSSSFIGDSDISRRFSHDYSELYNSGGIGRHTGPIVERSEPVTPEAEIDPRLQDTTEFFSEYAISSTPGDDCSRTSSYISTTQPESTMRNPDVIITQGGRGNRLSETTPLLPQARLSSIRKPPSDSAAKSERQLSSTITGGPAGRLAAFTPSFKRFEQWSTVIRDPSRWDARAVAHELLVRPVSVLPAVFLGLLLNLLDALSYGIILFPLGEEVFSSMGPDGVSMFYVSCIVSQLVYSSGSVFRGGVGSEMIEVVPFFHKMATMIIGVMGTGNPDAVRATVITSYAMSSILTGVVFFLLGSARLGTLVSFFPHSILVGCIGGVGIFLVLTGVEVSVRLDGNFAFTGEVFQKLIEPHSLAQWLPPLALAIILLVVKRYYDRAWLVPAYYIGITAVFYIVTTALPSVNMEVLRGAGWVFDAPDASVSFYNFYSYYQFEKVDWSAVWKTVPSQFALTFFGILHVPINIPNLALKTQEDNVSINRELILHGISNTLSGCVGSIQNYLVYVNSVLFMDTGGNSRLAGVLLAAATAGLWVAGPVVIGYVPVMVVATLIFYLGIDLAKEALVDTYGRLHSLEYLTIVIIAVVMGIHDFVVGVAVGIGLACLVYVVQTSRKPVVRAQFSGAIAESTVRRPARQRAYLHRVGAQIRVVKLGGYLFFGSIVDVEKTVRAMLDADAFTANPIRFLVLDFAHVTGIDFSAAEAFARINRLLHRRRVEMAFAGVDLQDEVGRGLQMDGLFIEVDAGGLDEEPIAPPKVYEDLNGALEACENILLITLLQEQQSGGVHRRPTNGTGDVQSSNNPVPIRISAAAIDNIAGSPRTAFRQQAATQTLTESNQHHSPTTPFLLNTATTQPLLRLPPSSESADQQPQQYDQPLQLLLLAFQSHTTRNADFWSRAAPYFERRCFSPGERLYSRGDKADGLYLVQKGILRARYALEQGNYHETIVAGTTCGELPFFSETRRTSDVRAAGCGDEDSIDNDLDQMPTAFESSTPAGLALPDLSGSVSDHLASSSSSSSAASTASGSSSSAAVIAWRLTTARWQALQVEHPDVARELLKVGLRLSAERMNAVTSYVLITAS